MKTSLLTYATDSQWSSRNPQSSDFDPQLLLVFGPRAEFAQSRFDALRSLRPNARIVSCSTSGDIVGESVTDDQLTAVEVMFDKTTVRAASVSATDCKDSFDAGQRLAKELESADLSHVLVFSDGQQVNGAQLARALNESLPASVKVTGGLAGDGTDFSETLVGLDESPESGRIVAVGLLGESLEVGAATGGGWKAFGPERIVTRAEGNQLFELDGESALEVYKRYLGDQAEGLPAAALRFPLCLESEESEEPVVRTILTIDEASESMTFAGEIPIDSRVRFMRGLLEDLVDGAAFAAEKARGSRDPDLALCISCVGRRIVFGQRVEEEIESVQDALGDAQLIGFYSYGELGPRDTKSRCQLHNQTMSITTFSEN